MIGFTVGRVAGRAWAVYRESLERYVPLRFSVRGRDLASGVEDAKRRIAAQVKLPQGVHIEWDR